MSNMHRIQWFDAQIRAQKYPNSSGLAERFEISKRQAQRDIEYLEVSLRAPLLYVAKHRGYIYEDHTFVLPLLYMTEEEKKVLKYLAHRYRHYDYDNAGVIHRIAHLLDRFTDEEEAGTDSRVPVFHASPRLIQNTGLLSHAIRHSLIVHIAYRSLEEELQLDICPLKIFAQYNADYVTAYCKQSNETRTFRLEGIQQVSVTSAVFDRSAIESTEGEEAASLIRKPFTARVVLPKPLTGKSWHGYPAIPVDTHTYEVEFFDAEAFMQHLTAAEWTRLLAPKWLKRKLQNKCRNVLALLEDKTAEERG